MAQSKDDLEAVRVVIDALEGFDAVDQERIIRWAREKLGLSVTPASSSQQSASSTTYATVPAAPSGATSKDLKTFIAEKKPKNDVQFAATVAYYYRFEPPQNLRKDEINGDDLQEGCRLVGRERLKHPSQTLRNAHNLGLLNRGSQPGSFTVSSVGENLVAVTLPGDGAGTQRAKRKNRKNRGRRVVRVSKKK